MLYLFIPVFFIFEVFFSAKLVETSNDFYIIENNKSIHKRIFNENIVYNKLNEPVKRIFRARTVDTSLAERNEKLSKLTGGIIHLKEGVGGSTSTSNQSRVGYQLATPEETPFVVLLYSEFIRKLDTGGTAKKYMYSVGSLIHEQWVLTSASKFVIPFYKRTQVTVFAGVTTLSKVYLTQLPPEKENGSQSVLADKIYYHPKFDINKKIFPNKYDFALIRLKKEFNITDTVRTMRLSPTGWPFRGFKKCKATGFGAVFGVGLGAPSKDDFWRKTYDLKVETFQEPKSCKNLDNPFLVNQLAVGTGLCKGDFGAGLVCEGMIRAVFSDILDLKITDSCLTSSNENAEFKCGATDSVSLFQDTCAFLTFVNAKVHLFQNNVLKECKQFGDVISNDTVPEVDNASSRTNSKSTLQINFVACVWLFSSFLWFFHE